MEVKQAFKRAYGTARAEYNEYGSTPPYFEEDMGEIVSALYDLPDATGQRIARTAREIAESRT